METGEKDLYSSPVLSVFFCITILFFSFLIFFFYGYFNSYHLQPLMLISQFFKILKEIFEKLKLTELISVHDLNCIQKCEIFILINIFFQGTKNLNFQVIFVTFNFHGSCLEEYSRNTKQLFVYHNFSLINHQVI